MTASITQGKQHPVWFRYGIAFLAVALAVVVRIAVHYGGIPLGGDSLLYFPFCPAVIFVTLYAGLGPGFLALGLSAATVSFWIGSDGKQALFSAPNIFIILLFVLVNLLIVWSFERLRRAPLRKAESEASRQSAQNTIGGQVENIAGQAEAIAGQAKSIAGHAENIAAGHLDNLSGQAKAISGQAAVISGQAENLRMAQARLAFAMEAGRIGVWDLDALTPGVGRPAHHDTIIGYESPLSQWDYGTFLNHVTEGERPEVEEKILRAVEMGEDWSFECRVRYEDGQVRWVWVRGKHSTGHPRLLGLVEDITERKRAEEALIESENRYRGIFDTVVDAIIIIDEMGIIAAANPAAEKLFGYRADELIGRNVNMLMPSPYHEQHDQYLENYRRTGIKKIIGIGREVVGLHKNGSTFPIRLGVSEMRIGERRIFTGQVHDITERKQAEARLRLQSGALEAAANSILITDSKGVILWTNAAFTTLTGYSREEVIGKTPSMLKSGKQDTEFYRDLWDTILAGKVWHGELINRRKDGTHFTQETTITPVKDSQGEGTHFIAIEQDNTERKQAEGNLKKAIEAAETANRDKDRFLAILSHELRTPLTPALMTISSRETDSALTDELREELAMVRRNLELEARLIDDLLDLNRIVRGKIGLRLQPTDLHATLRSVLAICREEVEAKRLNLRLELAAPQHNVNGDGGRLQQVFWNLLNNATKFTPANGTVTVRTSNSRAGIVRTEVADTGRGIAPQVIPSLFVAFEQGETRVTQQFGGLGMGLAICKAVVDLHGGKIWVESEGEGKGATFFVELPAISGQATKEPTAYLVRKVVKWNPKIGERTPRILLVEDNADTLQILRRLLERAGCKVTPAKSVSAALAAAQKVRERGEKFDLLISDLGLPDGDGREIMQELRDRDGLSGIAISGYGMEDDIEKSRAAGFAEHLTKPIQIEELQAAISQLVGHLPI